MRRFVIARHGNTFSPDEPPRRIGARTDIPLTPEGLRQAEALAGAFSTQSLYPDLVLCGPLRRSRDTAAAITSRLFISTIPVAVDWLDEIDHGRDENRSEADVIARIGRGALADWDRHGTAPSGWRVDASVRLKAWQTLFASPGPATTLLVTSNGAARFALLADPALRSAGSLKLRTGAYGIIDVENTCDRVLQAWDVRP